MDGEGKEQATDEDCFPLASIHLHAPQFNAPSRYFSPPPVSFTSTHTGSSTGLICKVQRESMESYAMRREGEEAFFTQIPLESFFFMLRQEEMEDKAHLFDCQNAFKGRLIACCLQILMPILYHMRERCTRHASCCSLLLDTHTNVGQFFIISS